MRCFSDKNSYKHKSVQFFLLYFASMERIDAENSMEHSYCNSKRAICMAPTTMALCMYVWPSSTHDEFIATWCMREKEWDEKFEWNNSNNNNKIATSAKQIAAARYLQHDTHTHTRTLTLTIQFVACNKHARIGECVCVSWLLYSLFNCAFFIASFAI